MGPRIPSGRRTADDRAPEDAPGDGTVAEGALPARRDPGPATVAPSGRPRATEEDEAPDSRPAPDSRAEERSGAKGLGLSVPQVAASTAAAVSGAFAASGLGVYGTIIGAGVISVVATVGGALYQRLFDKTGEQLRDATRPRPRDAGAPASRHPDPPRNVDSPRQVAAGHPESGAASSLWGTRPHVPGAEAHPGAPGEPSAEPGYTAATEYGVPRRRRLLRRRVVTAVAVFLLAMVAVTGIELATGTSAPQTSVGDLFSRDDDGDAPSGPEDERPDAPVRDGDAPSDPEDGGSDGDAPVTPSPDEGEQRQPGEGDDAPGEEPGGAVPDTSGQPGQSEAPEPPPGGTPEPTPTAPDGSRDDGGDLGERAPENGPADRGAVPEE